MELCVYVIYLLVDNYYIDVVILYKDIMILLKLIGVDVEIKLGIGLVIYNLIKII